MTNTPPRFVDHLANIFCPAPVLSGLTREQVAALVEFKSELMASLNKLYLVVPQTEADKLLKDFVDKLP